MRYYAILLLSCCLLSKPAFSQELNAQVQVISSKINTRDTRIFTTLETAIRDFLNNRKWTNETYAPEERIDCQFIITIDARSSDEFSGNLQVLYSRPIYKSGYNSPVLNYRDKDFNFKYLEYDRLDFSLNSNLSNLTSMLGFYAYVIIGLDHDTYSLKGGDPYYSDAEKVLGNVQGGDYPGWTSFESNRNRFWLLDNLTSPAFENMRTCLYQYHRLGLDKMYDPGQQKEAKETIKNALLSLKTVHDKKPGSYIMQIFFDAKSQEIINIFSDGDPIQLADLKDLLIKLDGNNGSKYEAMGRA